MAAKFSEERIESLAAKIADQLDENDLIRTTMIHRPKMIQKINRAIFEDQVMETQIEQEAIKQLEPLTKKYAPGSPQWEAMYLQAKERIAAKKNFDL